MFSDFMPLPSGIRRWFNPAVALAFDDKTLWSVTAPEGAIRKDSACLALDKEDRRVRAVGEAANALAADPGEASGVVLANGFGLGTVVDHDVAEARIRHELRLCRSSPWSLNPRVLVTAPMASTAKRALMDALVNAGARDVITLPRTMAAAIGGGLPVDGEQTLVQIVLDGDWTGVAVIQRAKIVASWESAGGLDQIATSRLIARRAEDDRRPARIDVEMDRLRREGIAPGDEASRAFFLHVRERLWSELAGLDGSVVRAAQEAPVWLAGSCASISGLAGSAGLAWGRRVLVPPSPEEAPIRGARQVLGELDSVLKSFRPAGR